MGRGLTAARAQLVSTDLKPYQAEVDRAEAVLRARLRSGRADSDRVAVARRTWEVMRDLLRDHPGSVTVYEQFRSPNPLSLSAPQRWALASLKRANDEIFPHLANDEAAEAYRRLHADYLDVAIAIVKSPDMRYRVVVDRQRGRSYLYRENALFPEIMQVIASELMRWFESRPLDRAVLALGARAGVGLFLEERPDSVMLLRIAQSLPLDVEVSSVSIDRPAIVEAVELVIGLVPVVGNLVALYEAYAGEDLFGYRLTEVERGILAASVLLPIAGRLAKGGRALYSEARLVSMYGSDAASWSRTITASRRAGRSPLAARAVDEAEQAVRSRRALDRAATRRAASAVPELVRAPVGPTARVEGAVVDLLSDLTRSHRILHSLDEQALLRVLERGPNVNHLKGQLLEELIESRIVPWLRTRTGARALGVDVGQRPLEFIPGHIIRDANGRQITDGILAVREDGVLDIVAIFEAKAGQAAARELSLARGSISSLSRADRLELRAYAKDVYRELQDVAGREGRLPMRESLEDIERSIVMSEGGGQVRRDIERLSSNVDGAAIEIRVGQELLPVRISPTRTKFFGVLPRDVRRTTLERQLRNEGFSFELIGVDMSQRELRDAAAELQPLAEQMAAAP